MNGCQIAATFLRAGGVAQFFVDRSGLLEIGDSFALVASGVEMSQVLQRHCDAWAVLDTAVGGQAFAVGSDGARIITARFTDLAKIIVRQRLALAIAQRVKDLQPSLCGSQRLCILALRF